MLTSVLYLSQCICRFQNSFIRVCDTLLWSYSISLYKSQIKQILKLSGFQCCTFEGICARFLTFDRYGCLRVIFSPSLICIDRMHYTALSLSQRSFHTVINTRRRRDRSEQPHNSHYWGAHWTVSYLLLVPPGDRSALFTLAHLVL